ncbi:hypothetical protein RB595_003957 [Gaeumannomyces hyphopodioides]
MPAPAISPTVVASAKKLQSFLSSITPLSTLYLDLEGKDLGRHGTLDIITALVRPGRKIGLVDVQTLGEAAFTTANEAGVTLKHILEDRNVPKYLWDVRSDADALWAHHRVRLAGVTDVQLLENAARRCNRALRCSKARLSGLSNAIKYDLNLPQELLGPWLQDKQDIAALFDASDNVFSHRPLGDKIARYCAGDVVHLPALRGRYVGGLNARWLERVQVESARRIDEACSPNYELESEEKKFSPWRSGKTGTPAARPIARFENGCAMAPCLGDASAPTLILQLLDKVLQRTSIKLDKDLQRIAIEVRTEMRSEIKSSESRVEAGTPNIRLEADTRSLQSRHMTATNDRLLTTVREKTVWVFAGGRENSVDGGAAAPGKRRPYASQTTASVL